MAQNVIECSFGILKHHFQILLLPINYDFHTQALLPAALICLHNFILTHEPLGNLTDTADHDEDSTEDGFDPREDEAKVGLVGGNADRGEASNMCNNIAQRMWDDYQSIACDCDVVSDDDDTLSDELATCIRSRSK